MENKKGFNLLKILAIILITLLLILTLFKPGYVDLINPYHSDLYRYFLISEGRWTSINWLQPRPLMLVYLKLISFTHDYKILFLLLTLPSILFVLSIIYFCSKNNLITEHIPIIVLCLVIFGSPLFYSMFQYDFGGMLSGVFTVAAINYGYLFLRNKNSVNQNYLILSLLSTLVSIEIKPTFSFFLLISAAFAFIFYRNKKCLYLIAGVLLIMTFIYIKDKTLNSPFINTNDLNNEYSLIINARKNLYALYFYVKNAFTVPILIAFIYSTIILIKNANIKILTFLMLSIFSVSFPMILLPNRLWDIYSIYSTVIIGIIIMITSNIIIKNIKNSNTILIKHFWFSNFLALFTLLIWHSSITNPQLEWAVNKQIYNRNSLNSLQLINTKLNKKPILITGLSGPYHPFKNTEFINSVFPNIGTHHFLLNKSEKSWNEQSIAQENKYYYNEINFDNYSEIYIFGLNGNLIERFDLKDVNQLEKEDLILKLQCDLKSIKDINSDIYVINAIQWLNNIEEYDSAIIYGTKKLLLHNTNPWIYFNIAKAYKAINNNVKHNELIKKALLIEPNNNIFLLEADKQN